MMNKQQTSLDGTQPPSPSSPSQPSAPVRPIWRTEPDIDAERQQFLRQRLTVAPDVQQGIYPFRSVKLTRADIEWLLITHEQGRGPVEWSDPTQRERHGLDLRGADVQHINLRGLPLARLRGGLTKAEWLVTTPEQRRDGSILLNGANLSDAHLEGAVLRGAYMNETILRYTHLEHATLFQADLVAAYMRHVYIEGANLVSANLAGAYLRRAVLVGADVRGAFLDNGTNLGHVVLASGNGRERQCALLADVHWNDCNLAVLDWRHALPLGDELLLHIMPLRRKASDKDKEDQLEACQSAARANRQLANAMRAQGMNDEAVPFAYRAQMLQRAVLLRRLLWGIDTFPSEGAFQSGFRQRIHSVVQRIRNVGAYLFSWFLDIIAGYGYRPERSVGIYVFTILFFTLIYLLGGKLPVGQALIFSVTAFHGRGFLVGPFTLASPITAFAALEAVIGLFIEISFIATFTQRFFGR